ncbi:unnamed protein product [Blumeria hordei]|uniref:RNA polymerase II holoenzyme cyclin-like subunit n=2 Tax=Blumeria hordei TaxID=2867405 RepID=A0A383UR02_BLUHO|nr:putative cyclin Ctk2 [Blumeria hordei DH14]SZF02209.1 unnamed protein product [Blumeria hordei]
MAPSANQSNSNGASSEPQKNLAVNPLLSRIRVSNQYLFQQQIQSRLISNGTNPTREDNFRLLGTQWIGDVRNSLQLPVRTYCTAATYYHKFRLVHKDNEYQYQDAAAGALLTACKIEDTLKKSREILCAAHNLKVSPSEHLTSDDSMFEGLSKVIIGLERLMLEASGFDFRVRKPQKHLVKIAKEAKLSKATYLVAYDIMIDLYRTFAPLKQTSATMSFACLELAVLVMNPKGVPIRSSKLRYLYEKCSSTRPEILETLLDLLDLYTHFQKSSIVGPLHNIDRFIQIRIALNQEVEQTSSKNRYTEFHGPPKINSFKKTPITPRTPSSPSEVRKNGNIVSPVTQSPRSADSSRRNATARTQDGTIRFILDAEQAKREQEKVSEYFKTQYEEYEIEVEETVRPQRDDRVDRGQNRGRDERYNNRSFSKRARR